MDDEVVSGYRTMWHFLRLRHKIHNPKRFVESLMRDVSAGANLHYNTYIQRGKRSCFLGSTPRASTSLISDSTNLQFEYYIFELIGRVVLVDGHTRSTKASCLLSFVFLN